MNTHTSFLSFIVVLWIALLATICTSHPTKYRLKDGATCQDDPTFYSYHIHVLFWSNKNATVDAAFALRKRFMQTFQVQDGPCDDSNTTHPPQQLCMFEVDFPQPAGPFPVPEWAAFVPPPFFAATVPWIMQNRGQFDILVHPNSGCEIEDHRDWPVWGGNKWELDLSVMHYDCPGCSISTCISLGRQLMFTNQFSKCGLARGNSTNSPFVMKNPSQFCSFGCQDWVNQLENMQGGCPHICDDFSDNSSDLSNCKQHVLSLPEFMEWTTEICD